MRLNSEVRVRFWFLALAAGIFFLIPALHWKLHEMHSESLLRSHGVQTTGVIVSYGSDIPSEGTDKRPDTPLLAVQLPTAPPQVVHVAVKDLEPCPPPSCELWPLGASVRVLWDPQNPGIARLASAGTYPGYNSAQTSLAAGVLFLAVSALFFYERKHFR